MAITPSVCKEPLEAAHKVGTEVDALAAVAAIPSSPAPPPFARAPLEDRRKYEKLFCCDDDDSDDDGEQSQPPFTDSSLNGSAKQQPDQETGGATTPHRLKLTDEDSIGSATDLKNCSDEETDERPKRK